MRLVHLSDLHLQLDWHRHPLAKTGWRGAPARFELHALGRLKKFVQARDRVRRLVDRVMELSPDKVLVTGDLTAVGDEAELTEARELLEPLAREGRLAVIPGNHDRYTDAPRARRFERIFASYLKSDLPEYADAKGYPFVKLWGDRFAMVGLDSTRVPGWGHYVMGRVGEAQRDALERLLDDPRMANRTALVLSHHGTSGPSGRFHWSHSGLVDAKPLLSLLRGRAAMLLHGHSHHRYWHRASDETPHQIGGGSSTFGRRPAFWHVELDDHRAVEASVRPLL